MIDVNNLTLTMQKNGRVLLSNLSFSLGDGDKLAIIGEEGNGKSSLIKAIVDPTLVPYLYVEGQINKHGQKIGYLSQFIDPLWNSQTVTSFFLKDNPTDEEDYERFAEFDQISRYASLFNLNESMFDNDQPIETLSGGEKIKIQLIKILISKPDVLLLDEPTNDLDLDTLVWLENFIKNYQNPIAFISHDETLLENVSNCILHIEQLHKKSDARWNYEHIGYKEYVKKRKFLLDRQEQIAFKERADDAERMEKWRRVYNNVQHDLRTITRQDPHGARLLKKKMQAVKSQEKRFEKQRQNFTEIPNPEEAIKLSFEGDVIPNSRTVLDFKLPVLEIAGRKLSENIDLHITGAKRIVIVGKNGTGKTTLLKQIYGELIKDERFNVGYMPQNYDDYLNQYKTVMEFLTSFCETKDELTKARTYLGGLKFVESEVLGDLTELSGGQKAKLYLLKMVIEGNDVLVLDEPTRNLSPLSNPVIRQALNNFDGCIISVSHDRKFIQEVADEVYELNANGFVKKKLIYDEEREK